MMDKGLGDLKLLVEKWRVAEEDARATSEPRMRQRDAGCDAREVSAKLESWSATRADRQRGEGSSNVRATSEPSPK